jgi:hypothetical protein
VPNKILNHWHQGLAADAEIKVISSHGALHSNGTSCAVMGVGRTMRGGASAWSGFQRPLPIIEREAVQMIAKLLEHADRRATERRTHIQAEQSRLLAEVRWARLRGG